MTHISGTPIENLLRSINSNNLPKYGDCLKVIEENMTVLKTTNISRQARMELKNTLERMSAVEKEKFTAKPYPRISKFFQKLGQLIRGHGFLTKPNYGLKLAHKLEAIEQSIWRQELKNYLEGRTHSFDFQKMMEGIAKIPMNQFDDFIKIYIFTNAILTGEHKKLKIFKQLTEEQQNAIKTKYVNDNWYIPMFKILKGATATEINEFISDSMITRFTSHPSGFMYAWSDQRNSERKEPRFDDLAEAVIVRGFRKYLSENSGGAKSWMSWLLRDKEFGEDIIAILKKNLTSDEMAKLPS